MELFAVVQGTIAVVHASVVDISVVQISVVI